MHTNMMLAPVELLFMTHVNKMITAHAHKKCSFGFIHGICAQSDSCRAVLMPHAHKNNSPMRVTLIAHAHKK